MCAFPTRARRKLALGEGEAPDSKMNTKSGSHGGKSVRAAFLCGQGQFAEGRVKRICRSSSMWVIWMAYPGRSQGMDSTWQKR